MWVLGPLGFTAPGLLLALGALPILWLLLRAVPPAPVRERFPGVDLLLGLTDDESQTDRTPWWLLLLRLLAVALAIFAFAGPVLNPDRAAEAARGQERLLLVVDGSWAGADRWAAQMDAAERLLTEAQAGGRAVSLVQRTAPPAEVQFRGAETWLQDLPGLRPEAWAPQEAALLPEGGFDTIWLSDGLADGDQAGLAEALTARGDVTVLMDDASALGLRPPTFAEEAVEATVLRADGTLEEPVSVHAIGRDPQGFERVLETVEARFAPAETEATLRFELPPELRSRITRFEVVGHRSAGAVSLAGDSLQRKEVALIAGAVEDEALSLLSPLHYLRNALEGEADVIEGTLLDVLQAKPDVIVLADVAVLAPSEVEGLTEWMTEGGMLLRFAGPRLAAHLDEGPTPLLPVRLRRGGRTSGGAMSWGAPRALAAFPEDSPFAGLTVPEEVTVTRQVLAEPEPELAARTIALLEDGTPLVTRQIVGQGQLVLVHVTANADWSNLPLSGLFVQMLERLAVVSGGFAGGDPEAMEGTIWQLQKRLTAEGRLEEAGLQAGIDGPRLLEEPVGPELPPGIYATEDRVMALNTLGPEATLAPAQWPAGVTVTGLTAETPLPLKGWLLGAALLLFAVDALASLALLGRLVTALLLLTLLPVPQAQAQDEAAIYATSDVVLAHVLTSDPKLDNLAEAGLRGLSNALFQRTAIEPAPPVGVDLETDDISYYPFLYWPISPSQPLPSAEAYAKLNRYLRSGGMILFDTRDADIAGFGSGTLEGSKLKVLAAPLDVPSLARVPQDHILTRTFYLLDAFPGRYNSTEIWAEAGVASGEGGAFSTVNDGVTPVVIGGNDWAAAWAVDERGQRLLPVGRGSQGERQRELAYRFGINVIMHVLTGNYKSDQVHVPELLERLGQ